MSTYSIGQIVAGVKPEKVNRSGQPVWRNSYTEGQLENRLWRRFADGTKRGAARRIGAIMKTAKAYERRTRFERQKLEPGARNGAIGQIGIDVLEYLYSMIDYTTGQLDPAVGTIAEAVGHCYSAVHAALRRLRRAGFLQWIRRCKETGNKGDAGPQVEQITKAYILALPEPVARYVNALLKKAPVPDCALAHKAEQERQWQEMLHQISVEEMHKITWHGDELAGETFRRLAALIDQRERQEREFSTTVETGGLYI